MKTNNIHSKAQKLIFCLIIIMVQGCKKFVQISPPVTEIVGQTVYSNNNSAAAAMSGIYANMIQGSALASGNNSISYLDGLASDELTNYNPTVVNNVQFYDDAWTSASGGASNVYFWQELYSKIHASNAVIEGLANSVGVTPAIKQQLTGEAKFMRAFLHFYATELYGDIPLVLSSNYLLANTVKRSPQAQVFQQIITDLKDAQRSLPIQFVDGIGNSSDERVRPNKGAATALLARVYLYSGNNWAEADSAATAVINNSSLYQIGPIDNTFLKNNSEAIWQLQSVNPGYNTFDGYSFVLTAPPGSAPGSGQFDVALSPNLLTAFESGDNRRTRWVGTYVSGSIPYYFPNKYKIGAYDTSLPLTEYTMVLRLAEQYLIRAEAEANGAGNGLAGAVSDLNVIRHRAGLLNYSGPMDKNSLLAAIIHERQVELFTEWGHRWFDLKRTGNLNTVMTVVTPQKGGVWSSYKALLPIPLSEIQINHSLTQNSGY